MSEVERFAPPAPPSWGQRRELEKILGADQRQALVAQLEHDRTMAQIVARTQEESREIQAAQYVAKVAMNSFMELDEVRTANAANGFQSTACQQIELRFLATVSSIQSRRGNVFAG